MNSNTGYRVLYSPRLRPLAMPLARSFLPITLAAELIGAFRMLAAWRSDHSCRRLVPDYVRTECNHAPSGHLPD